MFTNPFSKESLKAVAVLLPIFYVIYYASIFLSASQLIAKQYIEEDAKVADVIGPVRFAIPAFFARSGANYADRKADAFYTFDVVGRDDIASILIRMVGSQEGWTILGSTLITRNQRVIVLKQDLGE